MRVELAIITFLDRFETKAQIMTELELKLSLPDQLATQAKAAGLLTAEAIERLVREAIRKASAQRLIEYGKRLREPGGPEITEAELESELTAVRAELREAGAGRP
jgi:post-segregation antitoxin (ccd killing protein)